MKKLIEKFTLPILIVYGFLIIFNLVLIIVSIIFTPNIPVMLALISGLVFFIINNSLGSSISKEKYLFYKDHKKTKKIPKELEESLKNKIRLKRAFLISFFVEFIIMVIFIIILSV